MVIERCSKAYAQAINIYNLAIHHKEICNSSECNVSLILLKSTILYLRNSKYMRDKEVKEVEDLLNGWPV